MRSLIGPAIQVFVVAVGGTGLAGFITAFAKRRTANTAAEVTLSSSAMERMTAAEDRAERAENKADKADARADRLEREMQKMRRKFYAYELWADQHQTWDREAVTEVETLGGHLRPPPELILMREG